jgi:hypothetical protein
MPGFKPLRRFDAAGIRGPIRGSRRDPKSTVDRGGRLRAQGRSLIARRAEPIDCAKRHRCERAEGRDSRLCRTGRLSRRVPPLGHSPTAGTEGGYNRSVFTVVEEPATAAKKDLSHLLSPACGRVTPPDARSSVPHAGRPGRTYARSKAMSADSKPSATCMPRLDIAA